MTVTSRGPGEIRLSLFQPLFKTTSDQTELCTQQGPEQTPAEVRAVLYPILFEPTARGSSQQD